MKNLHQLSPSELGQLFPIFLEESSPEWMNLYEEEETRILSQFQPEIIRQIDHIGSTAIPGIKSKPIIDILLQVLQESDNQDIIDIFKSMDYEYIERKENPPPHMMFVRGYTLEGFKGQTYHVHVRNPGDWNEIRFRDCLIRNKKIAIEYEKLNEERAIKYRNDRDGYTEAKTGFIMKVLKRVKDEII